MQIARKFAAAFALLGLAYGGAMAAAAQGESAAVEEPASGNSERDARICAVTIDPSQPAGTFQVTRQELDNGKCICYAYTGPAPQSEDVSSKIADLQSTRKCANAVPLAVAGPFDVATGRSFLPGVAAPIVAAAAGGGAATAAVASGGRSRVPVSP